MQLGPFWAADAPVAPIQLDVYGDDIDVYGTATATLTSPTGAVTTFAPATISEDAIRLAWPAGFVFDRAGIWTLNVRLGTSSAGLAIDPITVAVQTLDGWHSLSSIRREWADAPDDDAQLYRLLEISKEAAYAYLDRDTAPEVIPYAWREMQKLHSRSLWNAATVNSEGSFGGEGYVITPRPLDWMEKQLLRPNRGPLAGVY